MKLAGRWRLWLSEGAERVIVEAAGAHHPDEAGGVLLGVLAGRRPWVTEAIGVPSARPSRSYYELPAGAGRRALDRQRRTDSRLGYLGEWHSHPADVGPSGTDRRSMAALAADVEAGCPPGADPRPTARQGLSARGPPADGRPSARAADDRRGAPARALWRALPPANGQALMASPLFFSYAWADAKEADLLDTLLRVRGVPIWRDRRQMTFGTYNQDQARRGIAELCSGFALYNTDAVLASDFILNVELPTMDARSRAGPPPPFFAGVIQRRQVPFEQALGELRDAAAGIELGAAFGAPLDAAELEAGLRKTANAILAGYLAQELVQGDEVTLRIETRGEVPNSDPSLLHLCWSPPLHHDPELHPAEVWPRELLPALADLHTALESAGAPRRLRIAGNMHLSAALALGFEFRQPSGWALEIDHEFVPTATALVEPDAHGWRLNLQPGAPGAEGRLVVCLHATQDVADAMHRHGRDLPPAAATLHIYPPSGRPGRTSVDPASANALAAAIAERINSARREHGTTSTHLYVACPWPLATLLGWHLSSSGHLVMHEPDVERGSYRASCELR